MSPALRASLAAFLVFTAYFLAGSLISDSMRFPYGYVSAGGLGLFLATGYYVARHYTVAAAAVATGLAALFASLTAWGVMARLSPGSADAPRPQVDAIGEVVVLLTAAALLLGAVGAWLAAKRAQPKAQL